MPVIPQVWPSDITVSWLFVALCLDVYISTPASYHDSTPHATSHDYNSGLNAIHVTSISQHALDLVSISGACLHAGFLRLNRHYAKGLANARGRSSIEELR